MTLSRAVLEHANKARKVAWEWRSSLRICADHLSNKFASDP